MRYANMRLKIIALNAAASSCAALVFMAGIAASFIAMAAVIEGVLQECDKANCYPVSDNDLIGQIFVVMIVCCGAWAFVDCYRQYAKMFGWVGRFASVLADIVLVAAAVPYIPGKTPWFGLLLLSIFGIFATGVYWSSLAGGVAFDFVRDKAGIPDRVFSRFDDTVNKRGVAFNMAGLWFLVAFALVYLYFTVNAALSPDAWRRMAEFQEEQEYRAIFGDSNHGNVTTTTTPPCSRGSGCQEAGDPLNSLFKTGGEQ